MSNTIIDPIKHKDVKVIASRGTRYDEKINLVPVIAGELRSLVSEYFVCLLKDSNTGKFGLNALTGFEAGENLYLKRDSWRANYVPMQIRRQPFFMGITGEPGTQALPGNTVLTIQLDSKRVTDEGGEALFNELGEATEYLKSASALMANILQGHQSTTAFIDTLIEHKLIEPLKLQLTLANCEKKAFQGFYGIHEENLAALEGDLLERFHKNGYMQACYMIIASIGQIQKLVAWKNKAT